MADDRELYRKEAVLSAVSDPSAGQDILVHETTYESKLTDLVIKSPGKQIYHEVIREHDGSSPDTRKSRSIESSGTISPPDVSFEDPELEWGADKEIAIQAVSALANTHEVAVEIFEKYG